MLGTKATGTPDPGGLPWRPGSATAFPGKPAAGPPPAGGGPHVDGLRHGRWRIEHPDGSVEEGCYAGGLLHGEWILRDPAGRTVARERWCLGRSAGSRPTVGEDALCGVALPAACKREPAR